MAAICLGLNVLKPQDWKCENGPTIQEASGSSTAPKHHKEKH